MKKTALIGKHYELLNLDGTVIHRFKIAFQRTETTPSIRHEDGSCSPTAYHILVSENGTGWYGVYGGNYDRITA